MADFDFTPYSIGGARRKDSFSGMNRAFLEALGRMFAEAPRHIQEGLRVKSGFRSIQRQRELWANALEKYGSAKAARKWVAPPGRSQHNLGFAADLDFARPEVKQWVHANAGKYGLSFPLGNEDWHIELKGARKGKGLGLGELVNRGLTPENAPIPTPRPPDALNVAVNRAPLAPPQDFVRPMPSGPRPSAPAPMATMERARPMPGGPLPQAPGAMDKWRQQTTSLPQGPSWATNPLTSGIMTVAEKMGLAPQAAPVSLPPDRPVPMGPLAPQQAPPAIDPKILAAYQQMAATRMAAPAVPVPAATPAPPPVSPLPQPRPMSPPQTPGNFPDVPPAPPPSRPMDVYSGLASSAQDAMGNTVFSDPRGIGITNRFGATTYSPDGLTTASGGNFGGLGLNGLGDAFQPDPTLGGRSPAGNFARQGVGGLGGAAVGGLLGPVGALLGGLVGRELAKPNGGRIGDLFTGRGNGGGYAFPSAPKGGGPAANFSNRSDREMREISPKAARDIARGKTGLF